MVGVFVAFIRVVYGRMIYMSLPIPGKNISAHLGVLVNSILTWNGCI